VFSNTSLANLNLALKVVSSCHLLSPFHATIAVLIAAQEIKMSLIKLPIAVNSQGVTGMYIISPLK
jgi:hypothetical protein